MVHTTFSILLLITQIDTSTKNNKFLLNLDTVIHSINDPRSKVYLNY